MLEKRARALYGWLAGAAALLAILAGLSAGGPARAYISLVRFEAAPQADGSILVEWETAVQMDTAGFNLYRSERSDGPWEASQIVRKEPAVATTMGATYRYTDTTAIAGVLHYYLLEELTPAGPGYRSAVISAGIGVATPTATLTPPGATATPGATAWPQRQYLPGVRTN